MNAEATGSNPVEAPKIFFFGHNWSHLQFIYISAVHIISFCFIPFTGKDELNKLACSQCMGIFIAQLEEHCSANAEATGSNPVEAPKIFLGGLIRNCSNCNYNCGGLYICISAVNIISFYLKEIGDQVPRQVGQQAEVSSVEAFAPQQAFAPLQAIT